MCYCTPSIRTPVCNNLNCVPQNIQETVSVDLRQPIDLRMVPEELIRREMFRRRRLREAHNALQEAKREYEEAKAALEELEAIINSDGENL